jgi:signal transduction histidine kinase
MNSRPRRLLIVDDNEMNRDMLARRLERKGYVISVAACAQGLLEHLSRDTVDLVLLDIEMPDISGIDILQQLRAAYSPAELPIMMVTARHHREDIVNALDLGANDYLTKPIDFPIALARIRAQLSLKEAEESLRQREQGRIGRDLHDGIGQHLTGIAFMSKVLEQKLADRFQDEAADAAKIVQYVNETISKTRELSRGLLPVSSNPSGLKDALERWAGEVQEMFGITCRFFADKAILIYEDSLATHLYRIAQEAVNNAIKHGHPTGIDISLTRVRDGIALEIQDNGTGLPNDAGISGGIGLRIMRYRAKVIGGTLQVQPRPEGGTIISCYVEPGVLSLNRI